MVLYISIRFNFKEINNYSVISVLTHPRRKVSHWILITTNILHCKCLILQESLHRNNLWFDNFELLKPLQRGMVSFYFKWFTSKYNVRLLTVQTITKHSIIDSTISFIRSRLLQRKKTWYLPSSITASAQFVLSLVLKLNDRSKSGL